MADIEQQLTAPRVRGLVLHGARRYDLLVWLFTFGRERAFREKMLSFARLQPGEVVLDVGCGTGALAILAAQQVGSSGSVIGIDASPEMIARATRKATRQGSRATFKVGTAQALPFPDARYDVVVTTLVLHHLPRPSRQQLAQEMRRVLKPGGRVLAIDFGEGDHSQKSLLDHFHRPHGHSKLTDMVSLLSNAGLAVADSGAVGMKDLQFVRATHSGGAVPARLAAQVTDDPAGVRAASHSSHSHHGMAGRHWPIGVVAMLVAVAVLLHAGVGALLFAGGMGSTPMTVPVLIGLAALVTVILAVKSKYILDWNFKRRRSDQGRH